MARVFLAAVIIAAAAVSYADKKADRRISAAVEDCGAPVIINGAGQFDCSNREQPLVW